MNLYVYFAHRSQTFPMIQPEHRPWFASMWVDLLNCNLPASQLQQAIDPVCTALSQPDVSGAEVKQTIEQTIRSHPKDWKVECSDFFAFAFVYAGLYQGVFVHWIDPLFSGAPASMNMDVGLPLVLSTVMVYGLFKLLLDVLSRQVGSWKRWALLGGAFLLYIGCLYVLQALPQGVSVPILLVLLISGGAALGMHLVLCRYFEIGTPSKTWSRRS